MHWSRLLAFPLTGFDMASTAAGSTQAGPDRPRSMHICCVGIGQGWGVVRFGVVALSESGLCCSELKEAFLSLELIEGEPVAVLPRDECTLKKRVILQALEDVGRVCAGGGLKRVDRFIGSVEVGKRLVEELPRPVNSSRRQAALIGA